jgi:outer membrane protein assembly factor BamA
MKKSHIILLVVFYLVSVSCLFSQNKDGAVHMPEDFDYPYITITTVEIEGNKLTKDNIIIRELDFKIGDTLAVFSKGDLTGPGRRRIIVGDSSELRLRLNYSRDNIVNSKLFLMVDLYLNKIKDSTYELRIDVNERHYWWIFPVLKLNAPNFNEWLRDIDISQLSMGAFASHNNLFGSSHQASVAAYVGPSWAIALGYRIPWIGRRQKKGLTIVGGYNNLAVTEYTSTDNRRQMLYERNSYSTAFVAGIMNFRPGLYHYYTIKVTGEYVTISDSLFTLNPDFLAGDKKWNATVSLYFDYSYDTRNNKSYPLEGLLLKAFVDKRGLGIVTKDVNLFYYGIDFHFHQKLSNKWYVAEMFKLVNSAGEDAPYYYQQSMTTKKDFIRGYDLYTIRGDQMYYLRSNIKYELVKPSVKKVKEGQEENKFKAMQYAFYLNIFADAGYVLNRYTDVNPLNNKMLYSWGLGLDFVTYYNMVLRFEYTFNSAGTNGFFIGFGMPI